MQAHYTDERLAMLLAHAQSGRLAFDSCCCFIGVPNAPHALCGNKERGPIDPIHHRNVPIKLEEEYYKAENAFLHLETKHWKASDGDSIRRRILIPMIKAEMKRRERVKFVEEYKAELALVTT